MAIQCENSDHIIILYNVDMGMQNFPRWCRINFTKDIWFGDAKYRIFGMGVPKYGEVIFSMTLVPNKGRSHFDAWSPEPGSIKKSGIIFEQILYATGCPVVYV